MEAKKFPVEPTNDNVIVEQVEAPKEKKKGAIVLPGDATKRPDYGVIKAVGPGKLLDDGKRAPMNLKVGYKVIYAPYSAADVEIDDKPYKVLAQNGILGVFVA
jgi:chaperonin GroES